MTEKFKGSDGAAKRQQQPALAPRRAARNSVQNRGFENGRNSNDVIPRHRGGRPVFADEAGLRMMARLQVDAWRGKQVVLSDRAAAEAAIRELDLQGAGTLQSAIDRLRKKYRVRREDLQGTASKIPTNS
ncbi:hypothetical protein [Bosea vestrisii]|uniref:Uncharacterized protein n=1 Tax=Bosea vestrisii TaxID=151416 RepID=A0ABW0H9P2_9HYPH